MPAENLHSFFNTVTQKEMVANPPYVNARVEDRCTRSAKILVSAAEQSLENLNFQPEENGWLIPRCTSHLTRAEQAACKLYSAETETHQFEVLDRTPHVSMSSKKTGDTFRMDRIIAIRVKGSDQTVLLKMRPNSDPTVQLHKEDKFMPYKDVMMHMNPHAVGIAFQNADEIMKKINAVIPLPDWAVNFDRDYQIKGRHVVRKLAV